MSDQVKNSEAQEDAKEMEIIDEATSLEDGDLEDVSGGCTNCADGCSTV